MSCTEQMQGYPALLDFRCPLKSKNPTLNGSHPHTAASGWKKKREYNIQWNNKEYIKWNASLLLYVLYTKVNENDVQKAFFPSQHEARVEHSWEPSNPQLLSSTGQASASWQARRNRLEGSRMTPPGNPINSLLGRCTVQLWDSSSFWAFEAQEVLDIASEKFH